MIYLVAVTFSFAIKNLSLATFLDKGSFFPSSCHGHKIPSGEKKKKGRSLLFSYTTEHEGL